MATWPATLPSFREILEGSYNETAPNNVLENEMDVGPPKARLRTTAGVVPFSGSLYFNDAQTGYWDTFYEDTINYGADEFDAVHPRKGSACEAIFYGRPQLSRMGTGWRFDFTAGILP